MSHWSTWRASTSIFWTTIGWRRLAKRYRCSLGVSMRPSGWMRSPPTACPEVGDGGVGALRRQLDE
eukprot:6735160-Alexandrium_andersonii.AAC.1